MSSESTSPVSDDPVAAARQRVVMTPFPDWASPQEFDRAFAGKAGDPLTCLLACRQVHAERAQTLHHNVVRLQSFEAVQHQSQWRLGFEPRTQAVFLHWIRIHRGDAVIEHADLARVRFLQREEGLEGQVLDGWFTLLLVLEDVRPGDLLDTCFTVESRPRLMPEHCFAMFSLAQPVSVGRAHFSVRFNETRSMRWKSSSAEHSPSGVRVDGELIWTWELQGVAAPKAEPNVPEWHLPYPWIQVSDAPDWTSVSREVCAAWAEAPDDAVVGELAGQIAAAAGDPAARVARALQIVQEEHRYLSVNVELGGQVPAAPGLVARRRYGDCKDLSFLLVHLLRRLGVASRPVLVHTQLQRQLIEMLPSPSLFNHVVVEFQLGHEVRWVDVTIKRQGGGPLERFLPDFGVGLPVDPAGTGLAWPPEASLEPGVYEVRETLLLDTSGAASQLAIAVCARGGHAEMLRTRWETVGVEELARERLQQCVNRFGEAKRVGELRHRDDRVANEFAFVEVFEVNGFLRPEGTPGYCEFGFPNSVIGSTLPLPADEPRRAPWALPHPCHIEHTIEVESSALHPMAAPRRSFSCAQFEIHRRERSLHNYLAVTFSLRTLRDHVPAGGVPEFRRQLEEVWKWAFFGLRLPLGQARPRGGRNFGEIPERPLPTSFGSPPQPAGDSAAAQSGEPRPLTFISPNTAEPDGAARLFPREYTEPAETTERRPRRHRHPETRRRTDTQKRIILVGVVGGVVIFLLICFLLARLNP